MSKTAIELIELTHCYSTYAAVDRISFTLESGKILGLLGPNGAGKSTTIKMLTTLLPVTSGAAIICGHSVVTAPALVREHIGYVPQMLSADGELTGYENLLFSAKLYGLSKEKRKKRIPELLEFMGLTEFADQQVNRYSGGMIRRLEIATALIHQPRVLFLDEPTVGLDPAARRSLWKKIEELQHNFGTTILLTTHDMEEADTLCDIVAFMHLGHIVLMDTPETLKAKYGPHATLDDVFLGYTGATITEGGDYAHAKEIRRTVSRRD